MPHGGLAPLGWRKLLLFAAAVGAAAEVHNETTTACPAGSSVRPMSPAISAIVRQAWEELDPRGAELVAFIKNKQIFAFFSHARSTFQEHLLGTFAVLNAWEQPAAVCRAGLFHTAYSGDLFQFYVFDASKDGERAELRAVVGAEAEQLTWLFGTVRRGEILGLNALMNRSVDTAQTLNTSAPDGLHYHHHRLEGTIGLTSEEAAQLVVITLADYLEQMVEVNGWRDHHQVFLPLALYPGDGRPGIALHWISQMCHAVRGFLSVVPPIFDRCTRTITYEDEVAARDKYWRVVIHEAELTEDEQLRLLEEAAHVHNPFVAEPLLHVAQLHYRNGRYELAVSACSEALNRLYTMATAWDKRRAYSSWVGFARLLHLRASRSAQGLPSLPYNEELPPTSGGLKLVSIAEIASEMP